MNKLKTSRAGNENGASLIETAVVVPLLFLIIVILLDVTIFYTAKGVSASAAAEAANFASVAVNLDSADEDKRNLALNQARALGSQAATSFLMKGPDVDGVLSLYVPDSVSPSPITPFSHSDNSSSPVHFFFPEDIESNETTQAMAADPRYLTELLRERPFEVRVNSHVKTILLGHLFGNSGRMDTSVSAYGYRQTVNEVANPAPIACGGEPGLSTSDGCLCEAADPTRVIGLSGLCECRGNLVALADGTCGCPDGSSDDDGDFQCTCDNPPVCTEGIPNLETCRCDPADCPVNADGEQLRVWSEEDQSCNDCNTLLCAGENEINNPNSCECETCPLDLIPDPTNLACVCPDFVPGMCDHDPNLVYSSETCGCVRCSELAGFGNWAQPLNEFQCGCPVELHAQGYAECAALGREFNPDSCSCVNCTHLNRFYQHLNDGLGACACPDSVGDAEGTADARESCWSRTDGTYIFRSEAQGDGEGTCRCNECIGSRTRPEGSNSCVCPVSQGEIDICRANPDTRWNEQRCECQGCPTADWDQREWQDDRTCSCDNQAALISECVARGTNYSFEMRLCRCEDVCAGVDGYARRPTSGACIACRGNFTAHPTERRCICPLDCSQPRRYLDSENCRCRLCPDGEVANSANDGCVVRNQGGGGSSGPFEGT